MAAMQVDHPYRTLPGSFPRELAIRTPTPGKEFDMPNCGFAGDLCCDTEADCFGTAFSFPAVIPNSNGQVQLNCATQSCQPSCSLCGFNGYTYKDYNLDLIVGTPFNVMSGGPRRLRNRSLPARSRYSNPGCLRRHLSHWQRFGVFHHGRGAALPIHLVERADRGPPDRRVAGPLHPVHDRPLRVSGRGIGAHQLHLLGAGACGAVGNPGVSQSGRRALLAAHGGTPSLRARF